LELDFPISLQPAPSLPQFIWRRSRASWRLAPGCRFRSPFLPPPTLRSGRHLRARALTRPPCGQKPAPAGRGEAAAASSRAPERAASSCRVLARILEAALIQAEAPTRLLPPASSSGVLLSPPMTSRTFCAAALRRRGPPRSGPQLCHLVRDLCVAAACSDPRVTRAAGCAQLRRVNDLPWHACLETLWRLIAERPRRLRLALQPRCFAAKLWCIFVRACFELGRRRQMAAAAARAALLLSPREGRTGACTRSGAPFVRGPAVGAARWPRSRPRACWRRGSGAGGPPGPRSLPPACRHTERSCAEGMRPCWPPDSAGCRRHDVRDPRPPRGRRVRDFLELGPPRPTAALASPGRTTLATISLLTRRRSVPFHASLFQPRMSARKSQKPQQQQLAKQPPRTARQQQDFSLARADLQLQRCPRPALGLGLAAYADGLRPAAALSYGSLNKAFYFSWCRTCDSKLRILRSHIVGPEAASFSSIARHAAVRYRPRGFAGQARTAPHSAAACHRALLFLVLPAWTGWSARQLTSPSPASPGESYNESLANHHPWGGAQGGSGWRFTCLPSREDPAGQHGGAAERLSLRCCAGARPGRRSLGEQLLRRRRGAGGGVSGLDELYLLPRLEVERLCDSRLDPPLDASSTAQPSADSATASTAALLNRRRRLVRADSLILRDPQARHAIDMLAAAGLAAAPPPRRLHRSLRRRRPACATCCPCRRTPPIRASPCCLAPPRRGLSAPPAEQRGRHGAAGRLRHRLGRGALRSLAHALDLFLSQVCQRIADQPSVSDYPDGLHKALADFGITEAWQLRRCYDPPHHRRPAPGAGPTGRSARPAGAAATPSAVSAAPEAVATAEVKAEPEDSAAGQGLVYRGAEEASGGQRHGLQGFPDFLSELVGHGQADLLPDGLDLQCLGHTRSPPARCLSPGWGSARRRSAPHAADVHAGLGLSQAAAQRLFSCRLQLRLTFVQPATCRLNDDLDEAREADLGDRRKSTLGERLEQVVRRM
uniref:Protein kinase domain-containing protein n=1 Tax=Macrostomum lignano TaxID=282301 RepID=A0A1I8FHM7_9PLAT